MSTGDITFLVIMYSFCLFGYIYIYVNVLRDHYNDLKVPVPQPSTGIAAVIGGILWPLFVLFFLIRAPFRVSGTYKIPADTSYENYTPDPPAKD